MTRPTIKLRLTPEQHAAIEAAAGAEGLSPALWVRRLACEAAGVPLDLETAQRASAVRHGVSGAGEDLAAMRWGSDD